MSRINNHFAVFLIAGFFFSSLVAASQAISYDVNPWQGGTSRKLFSSDSLPSSKDYHRKYPMRGDQTVETENSYYMELAIGAGTSFAIALLCCLCGLCFCCGKFVCKCGFCVVESQQYPRACCSNRTSKKTIRIFIVISSLMVIVAVVTGFVGNGLFSQGIDDLVDSIVNTIDKINYSAHNITASISKIDPGQDFTEFENTIDEITSTAHKTKDIVYSVDVARTAVIYFGFQFALTTAALGVAAVLLKKNKVFNALFLMCFAGLFFMWGSFAVHLPLSEVMDDTCYSIHDYLMGTRNISTMRFLMDCVDEGQYTPIFDDVFDLIQSELNQLNETTTEEWGYSFDTGLPKNGTTEERLNRIISTVNNIISGVEAEAEKKGPNSDVTKQLDNLTIILGVCQNLVDLISCKNMRELIIGLQEAVCAEMLDGLVIMVYATGGIGLFFIPLVITAILAANRFDIGMDWVRSRIVVEAVALIQIILGLVAIAISASRELFLSIGIGIINVVIPIFGFYGAHYLKRLQIILYASIESVLLVVNVVMLGITGAQISKCEEPHCTLSDRLEAVVNIFYLSLAIVPVLVGVISSWILVRNYNNAVREDKLLRDSSYGEPLLLKGTYDD